MAREVVHLERSRSWFSGTATTLCGITYPRGKHKTFWFASTNCRACLAIQKAEGR
ncbi:MAG: hypothetical protein JWQ81_6514 [Amycolatopsis sp.]|jgi:hypothetical protein|nr:hypothetical protein [Amycolatopsis sp.]